MTAEDSGRRVTGERGLDHDGVTVAGGGATQAHRQLTVAERRRHGGADRLGQFDRALVVAVLPFVEEVRLGRVGTQRGAQGDLGDRRPRSPRPRAATPGIGATRTMASSVV